METNDSLDEKLMQAVGDHDSHGLCYDIRHEDGTMGCYDPSELEVLN